MWTCQLCEVSFAVESIEQHVYQNHLRPRWNRPMSVFQCGRCTFSAEGFEEMAQHFLGGRGSAGGHEPTLVETGPDFFEYVSQLFVSLDEILSVQQQQSPSVAASQSSKRRRRNLPQNQPGKPVQKSLFHRSSNGVVKNAERLENRIDWSVSNLLTDPLNPLSSLSSSSSLSSTTTTTSVPVIEENTEDNEAVQHEVFINDGTVAVKEEEEEAEEDPRLSLADARLDEDENSHTSLIMTRNIDSTIGGTINAAPSINSDQVAVNQQRMSSSQMNIKSNILLFPLQPPQLTTTVNNHRDNHHKDGETGVDRGVTRQITPTAVIDSSGRKVFPCTYCSKNFPSASSCRRHHRVHTGERPHVCGTCGKSFAIAPNLVAHQRTHTDERPYGCHVCGKAFRENSKLRRHQWTHTDYKPFQCRVPGCGITFGRRTSFSRHVEKFHQPHRSQHVLD